ncbi:hypothetical protein BHE74_00046338 [Ensete ventricosum]|nr:hypothetical protein GW17_00025212 [Ensete ventricosum]RWW47651.1 hypothetical protein BHE74_00046338 [Ensete ventricosum]RZS25557.1 hypothetical protein BHM03_00058773 [Ensete ventricosum]
MMSSLGVGEPSDVDRRFRRGKRPVALHDTWRHHGGISSSPPTSVFGCPHLGKFARIIPPSLELNEIEVAGKPLKASREELICRTAK